MSEARKALILVIPLLLAISRPLVAGSFTLHQQFKNGTAAKGTGGLYAADLDLDGVIEVIIGSDTNNRIWLNDGNGTLSDSTKTVGISASEIFVADFDGDGLPDILTCKSAGNQVWWNTGSMNFTAGPAVGSGSSWIIS